MPPSMRASHPHILQRKVSETMRAIDRKFGKVLKDWDGSTSSIKGTEDMIKPLLELGLFSSYIRKKMEGRGKTNESDE